MYALASESLPVLTSVASAMIPIATPATRHVPIFSIRAMTAAASTKMSTLNPSEPSVGTPTTDARRKIANDASSPAIIHATVWTRPTGMPSSDARSAFSADARSAMPMRV